jgi:DNA-binding MarR family transcriptional regulator
MTLEGIESLLDEVRLLWHVAVDAAERLHADEPVTVGMRGVMEFVQVHGPATVPQVARSRHVTRQHIQTLVNGLVTLRLVALEENPAHRRSALVALTPEGRSAIERMRRRERAFLQRLDLRRSAAELGRAAETLRAVREALGRPA